MRGVLHDLTESGVVFRSGSGAATTYRAATDEELEQMGAQQTDADELIWLMVYREGPVTRTALARASRLGDAELERALERLLASNRIRVERRDSDEVFASSEFVIPLGQSLGWEAAVLDHFGAVVRTICRRLEADAPPAVRDSVGGSTYTFDVWDGHPMADEVYGWLRAFRERAAELRARLEAHNAQHGVPDEHVAVVVYGGQCVTPISRKLEEAKS